MRKLVYGRALNVQVTQYSIFLSKDSVVVLYIFKILWTHTMKTSEWISYLESAGVSFSSQYMFKSQLIRKLWPSRINSTLM